MEHVVRVSGGRLRGRRTSAGLVFAAVPYARPPLGPLRWAPPAPPEPWDGVRSAEEFGPMAPQPPALPGLSIEGDVEAQDEDCLTLNVWTPATDDRRRPVMVWIHGGSFISGTGSSVLYRGERLSACGDVVVVTLNYRLGALGFLAHPALGFDGTWANWGLLDQLAALRWVRDHIESFGGDPEQVTVFGESAGGMSVACLMATPAARGLFRRAVIQSGPPYTHTPARAAETAERLTAVLGLVTVDRQRLATVPADELVSAATELQRLYPDYPPGEPPLPFLPVLDDLLLGAQGPLASLASGSAAGVDLMIGTTRDEVSLNALGDPRYSAIDEAGLVAWTEHAVPGADGAAAIAHYRQVLSRRGERVDPPALWVAMGSDLVFRWPSLRLAAAQALSGVAVHAYLFTYETPIFGGILGACHALDIPFTFGSVYEPAVAAYSGGGPAAEALADQMMAAWAAFARSGDPSTPGAEPWPPWAPEHRATMVLGPAGGLAVGPRDEELGAWSDLLALPGSAPPST